jgi:general secretion pathway protein D
LGAIPLIGNLFKSRSGSRVKTDLLVFIRPKILRDAEVTEELSEGKYNGIRQQEKNLHDGHITLLPGERQPSIPPVPPGSGRPVPPPPGTNMQGALPDPPPSIALPPATAAPQPAPPSHP